MKSINRPININAIARKVDVDIRIPLRYYYRIADNLLKQASIYREERNLIDLYIILLRFSSLMSETIPFHRDYQVLLPKERTIYKKKLLAVMNELESLKPDFQRRVNELNTAHARVQFDGPERTSYNSTTSFLEWPSTNKKNSSNPDVKWLHPDSRSASQFSWKHTNEHTPIISSNSVQFDKQLQKLSLILPLPKDETLSRHSILGPNGLRGQWLGPSTGINVSCHMTCSFYVKLQLPLLTCIMWYSLNQGGQYGIVAVKDGDPGGDRSEMESVLSLDDGRWLCPVEESCSLSNNDTNKDISQLNIIRQPSPPPVLAHLQQDFFPISPSKVADPRPGPAQLSQDGMPSSNSYQHLHIPVKMMEDFLRLARTNTAKNLETCGILAGSLENRVFHITTLIVPKQESTSDSCQTINEEEIFDVQDNLSLFPLGWIHVHRDVMFMNVGALPPSAYYLSDSCCDFQTHPSQTCFMSSVDLHTHYSYQIMLPEAIAIVMAPTDTSSPHGIFHLSDPGGVSVIRNCQQRGFHPHEEPPDGSPIYEHCSHVYMNPNLKFDVVDLR
ncbi:hypothetical protein HHK36_020853 [Tetracentron sinense]|uniref:MPN domain-containing protein n=1 Tax=Tetracentron sinense TaxID=13715 RepID=A0A835DC06_TETSI|nr:hypothetical protein HHK36_020853 [Tetracentron sinense]